MAIVTNEDLKKCRLSRKELARRVHMSYGSLVKKMCGFSAWGPFEQERLLLIVKENPKDENHE